MKTNKLILSAFALCATVSFTSCSQDEMLETTTNAPKAITFNVADVQAHTRAAINNSNIKNQTIKVWGDWHEESGSSYREHHVYNGATLSYSNSKWNVSSSANWLENRKYVFYSFCPATPKNGKLSFTYSPVTTLTLDSVPASNYESNSDDYLFAKTTINSTQGKETGVNITMKHLLSRINYKVKRTGNYKVRLTKMMLCMPGSNYKCKYESKSGWSWLANDGLSSTTTQYSTIPTSYTNYTTYLNSYTYKDLDATTPELASSNILIVPKTDMYAYVDIAGVITDDNNFILKTINKTIPVKITTQSGYAHSIIVTIDTNNNVTSVQTTDVSVDDYLTGDKYNETI